MKARERLGVGARALSIGPATRSAGVLAPTAGSAARALRGEGLGTVRATFAAALAWLAIALWSAPAHAAVNAWLDSTHIAPGDSVQLTLEHDGQTSSRPDLAPLERDFDVLGTNRTTSVQIVNGSASSKSEVSVTLSPKHAGRLTVPPIVWGGERSPALTLDVAPGSGSAGSASGAGGATAGQKVFVRMQFSPPQPYVQAAVHVTLRLYTREALYDPSVSFPATGDVLIQRVGKDVDSSVEQGGESYEVVTRHYVVFPQRSGDIELPGPVLNARVAAGRPANPAFNDPFAGFFGPTPFGNVLSTVKPIRLHSGTISLHVRPRPAGAGQSYWLPASDVTLQGTWHPAALHAQAGNPVTVDLTLQARGLTAAQLPNLAQLLVLPPGLKAYPDQPQLTTAARGDAVIGTRTQSIALIADQPGRFTIPALQVKWWDTGTNRRREATLPARTLIVAAAPGGGSGSGPGPGSGSGSGSATAGAGAPAPAAGVRAAPAASAASTGPTGGASSGGTGVGAGGRGPSTLGAVSSRSGALGAASGSSGAASSSHLAGKRPVWLWVSAALALVWFVTLGAWAFMRRRARRAAGAAHDRALGSAAYDSADAAQRLRPEGGVDYGSRTAVRSKSVPRTGGAARAPAVGSRAGGGARAAFRSACARNDAAHARRQLLEWVAAEWPPPAPAGLNALARQIEDAPLAELLRELDRACYADEPWQGAPLATALEKLPPRKRDPSDRSESIAPLYP